MRMKKKITKERMLKLYNGLSAFPVNGNKLYAYMVAVNKYAVEADVKFLMALMEPSEEYTAYVDARKELMLKYCIKNEDDTPKIVDENIIIPKASTAEWKEAQAKLEFANTEVISQRRSEGLTLQKSLTEEVEVDLEIITFSELPNEVFENAELMDMLIPIIERT